MKHILKPVLGAIILLSTACVRPSDKNAADSVRDSESEHPKPSTALTPPMGWNSWNSLGFEATEKHILEAADYMAENLKEYGWEYVVLDMGWFYPKELVTRDGHRINPPHSIDKFGRLIPDPVKFPSSKGGKGFKPIADYIHTKGLKFGIHIMRGVPWDAYESDAPVMGTDFSAREFTLLDDDCDWNHSMKGVDGSHPGSMAYYRSLIELYNSWDVDFIKVDDIARNYHAKDIEIIYALIQEINPSIVLSLSPGPTPLSQAEHLSNFSNMWRVSNDFWDHWKFVEAQFEYTSQWYTYIAPGSWPDLDMLTFGKLRLTGADDWVASLLDEEYHKIENEYTRFTRDEVKTVMSLWCIFRSPLMIGGYVPDNDEFTHQILSNPEILEINQNSHNNRLVQYNDSTAIWLADVPGSSDKYVAMFNLLEEMHESVSISFEEIGLSEKCSIRDLWEREEIGTSQGSFSQLIPPHGAGVFRISQVDND